MVNKGKPSRACQACKSRRTKCDQTYPQCNVCTRMGRVCPGVPNATDLLFRNQTALVKAKKQVHTNSRSPTFSPEVESSVALETVGDVDSPRSDITLVEPEEFWMQMLLELSPSMEDIAVNCFVNNFVLNPQRSHGLQSYLSELAELMPFSLSSSSLHRAATSVALSSIGEFPEFRPMKAEASKVYGRALHLVGADINNPRTSKSNETLLSVMLLAIFEARVATEQSLSRYQHHLAGAMTLLRHRGHEQFKDPKSLQLFRGVRTQIVLNRIRTGRSLDIFETDPFWTDDLSICDGSVIDPSIFASKIPLLRKRTDRLLQRITTAESTKEAHDLVAECSVIDNILQAWHNELPQDFQYTVAASSNFELSEDHADADVWRGVIHTYANISIAQAINHYRVVRLYVHELIIKSTIWLNSEQGDQESYQSFAIIQQMVDEICASVPYYLNYSEDGRMSPIEGKNRDQIAAEANGAYLLVWPLSVAVTAKSIPEVQRKWIRQRMCIFADRYGYNQARVLSK